METKARGVTKVKDFWEQTNNNGKWRTWGNLDFKENNPLKAKVETLLKRLDQRKILKSKGKDQLRWGYKNEGVFNLKEEKLILPNLNMQDTNKIWLELWREQGWMKIKLFMWLV